MYIKKQKYWFCAVNYITLIRFINKNINFTLVYLDQKYKKKEHQWLIIEV